MTMTWGPPEVPGETKRKRWLLPVIGLVVVAAVGLVVFFLASRGGGDPVSDQRKSEISYDVDIHITTNGGTPWLCAGPDRSLAIAEQIGVTDPDERDVVSMVVGIESGLRC